MLDNLKPTGSFVFIVNHHCLRAQVSNPHLETAGGCFALSLQFQCTEPEFLNGVKLVDQLTDWQGFQLVWFYVVCTGSWSVITGKTSQRVVLFCLLIWSTNCFSKPTTKAQNQSKLPNVGRLVKGSGHNPTNLDCMKWHRLCTSTVLWEIMNGICHSLERLNLIQP